jgi:hypothetical protein
VGCGEANGITPARTDGVLNEEKQWDIVAAAAMVGAGLLVRQALQAGWKAVYGEDPPMNPAARSVKWSDALAWTVGIGAAVGLGRLLAERAAAAGWKAWRGRYPKGLH